MVGDAVLGRKGDFPDHSCQEAEVATVDFDCFLVLDILLCRDYEFPLLSLQIRAQDNLADRDLAEPFVVVVKQRCGFSRASHNLDYVFSPVWDEWDRGKAKSR